jgi:hypothetical protein
MKLLYTILYPLNATVEAKPQGTKALHSTTVHHGGIVTSPARTGIPGWRGCRNRLLQFISSVAESVSFECGEILQCSSIRQVPWIYRDPTHTKVLHGLPVLSSKAAVFLCWQVLARKQFSIPSNQRNPFWGISQ